MYLIEFLHQTTTVCRALCEHCLLYLIEFLHQTTTPLLAPWARQVLYLIEFLHQTTTLSSLWLINSLLYLIEFLHQTTTIHMLLLVLQGCILLNFYIKPQRRDDYRLILRILQPFDDSRNLLSVRRRSRFDVFFRISKNKYSKISQKNSNCWGISGLARSLFPQKFRISPYCLSVTARMLVYPDGGIERLTRLM